MCKVTKALILNPDSLFLVVSLENHLEIFALIGSKSSFSPQCPKQTNTRAKMPNENAETFPFFVCSDRDFSVFCTLCLAILLYFSLFAYIYRVPFIFYLHCEGFCVHLQTINGACIEIFAGKTPNNFLLRFSPISFSAICTNFELQNLQKFLSDFYHSIIIMKKNLFANFLQKNNFQFIFQN